MWCKWVSEWASAACFSENEPHHHHHRRRRWLLLLLFLSSPSSSSSDAAGGCKRARAHRRPPLTESAAAICSSTVACSSLPDAPQHWCFTCSGSFLWSLYSCTLHVNVRKHPFSFTALGKNQLSALHQLICRNSSVVVDLLIFLLFRVLELFWARQKTS